ncbi:MAG TPA: extracellular solute-binding protein [Gaiellaceae bacterium]|jgi:putative spermidine/putrescine transport system substrate-binding protein
MRKVRSKHVSLAALAALVGALAFVAAGCGGGGDEGGDWQIEGLGSTLEEIQENARQEGEVNLIQWAGYAQLVDEFKAQTGCTVNTKDGTTSDDMVSLLSTGEYDGVSASGNASVRMMERGDVAPVNTDLIPNYADVQEGIKNQDYNSRDGQPYGVPHGRGPNLLTFRTDEVTPAPDSWSVIWDADTPYKGKISIYDDSIFIADAAVYLKATQPDLGIDNPYQLTKEQFDAAVNLLKGLAPNVGEWWADYAKQIQSFANKDIVVGTTWPYQVNVLKGDNQPVEGVKPKEGTTGWSDTWMIYSKAAHPNCMYLWMNHMISPEAQALVAEGFGEAPINLKACALTKNKNHCSEFHAEDEEWWNDVYYWTTPTEDCGGEGGTCMTQEDWVNAWTEIRG